LFNFSEQTGAGESPSTSQLVQGGSGLSRSAIEQISELVSEKLRQDVRFRPSDPNWRYYESSEPTTVSEPVPEALKIPKPFGVDIHQNDLNDKFDSQHLLKLVPKLYKQKATQLLEIFEQQPNDISYNSQGVLFIDSESVPNSNIFLLFPALFKRKSQKLSGLHEFINKLHQMNLNHLIAPSRTNIRIGAGKINTNIPSKAKWYFLK